MLRWCDRMCGGRRLSRVPDVIEPRNACGGRICCCGRHEVDKTADDIFVGRVLEDGRRDGDEEGRDGDKMEKTKRCGEEVRMRWVKSEARKRCDEEYFELSWIDWCVYDVAIVRQMPTPRIILRCRHAAPSITALWPDSFINSPFCQLWLTPHLNFSTQIPPAHYSYFILAVLTDQARRRLQHASERTTPIAFNFLVRILTWSDLSSTCYHHHSYISCKCSREKTWSIPDSKTRTMNISPPMCSESVLSFLITVILTYSVMVAVSS